jgi:predicted AlkP superfamily pyrophosphatase or phosphodiesterase
MKRYIICLFLFFTTLAYGGNKPYVILISFDGFRWDYLDRGLTPNLNKLADKGVRALSLRPAFPSKTFPNHISLITGMYPDNHGIIGNYFKDTIKHKEYSLGDTAAVKEPFWYLGEAFWETAERNGIITASYFWPGSEISLDYRRPTYYEKYDHNRSYREKVKGIVNWLKLPADKRPHFITLYFHDTDTYGHDYGPDSPETNRAIARLDSVTAYLLNEIDKTDLKDSINYIFVSDHGMTAISPERTINIEAIIEKYKCSFQYDGPVMFVNPPEDKAEEIYELLKKSENHFKVYRKEEMPEYFHYNTHPFIYRLILVADLGWSLHSNEEPKWLSYAKGNHGYDNNQIDMHGIFLAYGPAFKSSYKTGTLWNIDLYPLLCKIFGISPRSNIDGKLERIEFILKEN